MNKSLAVLVSVFFFWGYVAASNTILIPVFKEHFHLLQWQSQLVDFAFYIAYFVGSLIYFLVSRKFDFINHWGYKKTLQYGLALSAIGTLIFIPAAKLSSFPLFLTGLFTVALGFSIQQIVANPFLLSLGPQETGAIRINLAGGLNSLGTTIGPLILSYAIFGSVNQPSSFELSSVVFPYLILGFLFLLFVFLIGVSPLPNLTFHKNDNSSIQPFHLIKQKQIYLGMLAIFIYVGIEVSIQSNMPELIKHWPGLELHHTQSVHFISLYWGSLMIGRWLGALPVFNLSASIQKILEWFVPFIVYGLIVVINLLYGHPLNDFLPFLPMILLLIPIYKKTQYRPSSTLFYFGTVGAILILAAMLISHTYGLYFIVATGLYCSVLWPCIFAIALKDLHEYTSIASSLLIMMILGGAFIPPVQGWLADLLNIKTSYIVPLAGFVYLAYYGKINEKSNTTFI